MRAPIRAWVLLPWLVAACVTPAAVFTCETSDQCTVGGTCQLDNHLCSFGDPSCPTGQRYGAASGELSNQCVGGDDIDADPSQPDARVPDARIDAMPGSCTTPFVQSAQGCHAFLGPQTADHDAGRGICQGMSADLPVVESTEESLYIATSAGLTSTDRALLGLDFRTGTWTWVDGTTLTFTYWEPTEPDAGDNCGVIRPTTGTWAGRLCTEAFIVVCEK